MVGPAAVGVTKNVGTPCASARTTAVHAWSSHSAETAVRLGPPPGHGATPQLPPGRLIALTSTGKGVPTSANVGEYTPGPSASVVSTVGNADDDDATTHPASAMNARW